MKENVKNVSKNQENMRLKCEYKDPNKKNKKNEMIDNLRNG